MESVCSSVKEDELISARILETRFAPKPTLIRRQLFKLDSSFDKFCNLVVQVFAFTVDPNFAATWQLIDLMYWDRDLIEVHLFQLKLGLVGPDF